MKSINRFYKNHLKKPAGLSKGRNYFEECESIRGWAIILVFLFHLLGTFFYRYKPVEDISILKSFVYAGNTGVTLFFVLSGFLISMPYLRGRDLSTMVFYRNRLLRIMPLYALAVLLGSYYHHDIWSGVKSLLFVHTITDARPPLFPFGAVWWSLAIEMQFYIVLPFLMALFSKQKKTALLLFSLLVVAYMFLSSRTFGVIGSPLTNKLLNSLIGHWPNFLCGIVTAFCFIHFGERIRQFASKNSFLRYGGSDLLLFITLGGLGLVLQKVCRTGLETSYLEWHIHFQIEGFAWAVIIFIITTLPLVSKRIWVNPFHHLTGIVSYSIYLFHAPAVFFTYHYIKKRYPDWIVHPDHKIITLIILLIGTVYLVSIVSYLLIEKPFLKLKR